MPTPDLPASAGALAALVFGLGLRHGFDADHLAAVDSLTRMHQVAGRRAARWCGLRFALGHGAVVLAVALGAGLAREQWALPGWLDLVGAWISIAVLVALGFVNLRSLIGTPAGGTTPLIGLRSRWLGRGGRLPEATAIGALFALSFDTLGLAALFGLAGLQGGSLHMVAALALLFVAAMALVDGLNGLWVARLLGRGGPVGAAVSRAVAWAVTVLSFGVGAVGALRLAWPAGPEDADTFALLQGVSVLAVVLVTWQVARRRATASGATVAA
jgi:high-affinity nickel-transport protein